MSENQKSAFETHVYATVRIKVLGTNFSDSPQEIAEKVTEAVCADPDQWFKPCCGSVHIDGAGSFDIEHVEFSDEIANVLVDEIDPGTGHLVREHWFEGNELHPYEKKNRAKKDLAQLLSQLVKTQGHVSIHEGVVSFEDGSSFDMKHISEAFSVLTGHDIEPQAKQPKDTPQE